MSTPQHLQAIRSGLTLDFPQSLGVHDRYEDALRAAVAATATPEEVARMRALVRLASTQATQGAVQATDAVIQVGTNPYGHPTGETLSRLAAAGARVWPCWMHARASSCTSSSGGHGRISIRSAAT